VCDAFIVAAAGAGAAAAAAFGLTGPWAAGDCRSCLPCAA
jgi:hypothetical protein